MKTYFYVSRTGDNGEWIVKETRSKALANSFGFPGHSFRRPASPAEKELRTKEWDTFYTADRPYSGLFPNGARLSYIDNFTGCDAAFPDKESAQQYADKLNRMFDCVCAMTNG